MIDLTQLQNFQIVARLENITKAASYLHLSQPNMSRSIKQLEESLGISLFDREHGRLRLNQYGKIYLEHVNKAFGTLDAAYEKMRELRMSESASHMSIASTMSGYMGQMMDAFLEGHPDAHISLTHRQMEYNAISCCLTENSIDFALTTSNPLLPGLAWNPVFSCPICVLAGPRSPYVQRKKLRVSELESEPFVCNGAGIDRTLTEQICKRVGFAPDIVLETNEPAYILEWLQKRNCILFISAYEALKIREHPLAACCSIIPLNDPEPELTLGILQKPRILEDADSSPKSIRKELFDFAEEYFRELNITINEQWTLLTN